MVVIAAWTRASDGFALRMSTWYGVEIEQGMDDVAEMSLTIVMC